MQTKSSRFWRVVRFCIAGAPGLLAYYAALYCLTEYLEVWYIASAGIGYVLNIGSNFALQKFWTFQNKGTETIRRQIVMYFVVSLSLLLGNTIFLYLLVKYLGMWYITAQMVLTVVSTILSFVSSLQIFTNKKKC